MRSESISFPLSLTLTTQTRFKERKELSSQGPAQLEQGVGPEPMLKVWRKEQGLGQFLLSATGTVQLTRTEEREVEALLKDHSRALGFFCFALLFVLFLSLTGKGPRWLIWFGPIILK